MTDEIICCENLSVLLIKGCFDGKSTGKSEIKSQASNGVI